MFTVFWILVPQKEPSFTQFRWISVMYVGWTTCEIHRNHLKLVQKIQEDTVSILLHFATNKGKKLIAQRSGYNVKCSNNANIELPVVWCDYTWTALQSDDLVASALWCNSHKKKQKQTKQKNLLSHPSTHGVILLFIPRRKPVVLTKTFTKDLKFHPRRPGKMGRAKLNDGIPPPIYKQSSGGNHRQKSFLSKNIWCEHGY